MRKIMVDPTRLDMSASKIEQCTNDVEANVAKLYDEVELMKVSWQGKDNNAFTSQIRSFEEDFKQVIYLTKQYSEFLRNSASAYRETQNELTSQVSQITI